MHGINGMGWGMGWFWIIGIIIIVAIVWIMVKVMNNNTSSKNFPGKSALDILKERYAKGEISKDEFEEGRKDLM
jgi:putative membrane protein